MENLNHTIKIFTVISGKGPLKKHKNIWLFKSNTRHPTC
uniref:Uncharacterized protein n=1 Tax=Rhizophora mucronata TaxID=61149 RepID=A0A2P2NZY3_RHIMU